MWWLNNSFPPPPSSLDLSFTWQVTSLICTFQNFLNFSLPRYSFSSFHMHFITSLNPFTDAMTKVLWSLNFYTCSLPKGTQLITSKGRNWLQSGCDSLVRVLKLCCMCSTLTWYPLKAVLAHSSLWDSEEGQENMWSEITWLFNVTWCLLWSSYQIPLN